MTLLIVAILLNVMFQKKSLALSYIQTETGKYHFIVKELPSFYEGMCYIIESKQHFDFDLMTATIEKSDMDINFVKIWITSNYDFFAATTMFKSSMVPFQFTVPFGGIHYTQVTFSETIIKPLHFDNEIDSMCDNPFRSCQLLFNFSIGML